MYTDKVICGLYLVEYVVNLFISQNRRQFIFSASSMFDLLIFIPPLVWPYECGDIGLFLIAVSRLLRIYKAANALVLGDGTFAIFDTALFDTDVSRKIISIITMLVILIYISSGMFIVIENIGIA